MGTFVGHLAPGLTFFVIGLVLLVNELRAHRLGVCVGSDNNPTQPEPRSNRRWSRCIGVVLSLVAGVAIGVWLRLRHQRWMSVIWLAIGLSLELMALSTACMEWKYFTRRPPIFVTPHMVTTALLGLVIYANALGEVGYFPGMNNTQHALMMLGFFIAILCEVLERVEMCPRRTTGAAMLLASLSQALVLLSHEPSLELEGRLHAFIIMCTIAKASVLLLLLVIFPVSGVPMKPPSGPIGVDDAGMSMVAVQHHVRLERLEAQASALRVAFALCLILEALAFILTGYMLYIDRGELKLTDKMQLMTANNLFSMCLFVVFFLFLIVRYIVYRFTDRKSVV